MKPAFIDMLMPTEEADKYSCFLHPNMKCCGNGLCMAWVWTDVDENLGGCAFVQAALTTANKNIQREKTQGSL